MHVIHQRYWFWFACCLGVLLAACQPAANEPPTTKEPPTPAGPMAVLQVTITPTPPPTETPTVTPLPSPTPAVTIGQPPTLVPPVDPVQAFLNAPFRTVAIAKNPDYLYTLIVVTERSPIRCGSPEEPSRCSDDTTCGSLYTSPTCYFFFEPEYVFGADPFTRFVGEWQGGLDALIVESLLLLDQGVVRFNSAGCDGPCSVQASWELDTETGTVTETSRSEVCQEIDEPEEQQNMTFVVRYFLL